MPLIDRILFSDKVPTLMKKSLNMMSTRQNLISSNVSNVDTPGFKASDIDFQAQFREALGSKLGLNIKSTNEKHFGPDTSSVKDLTPDPFEEETAAKSNGKMRQEGKDYIVQAQDVILFRFNV